MQIRLEKLTSREACDRSVVVSSDKEKHPTVQV